MAIEIERKFLVSGDFLPEAVSSTRIVQGYICSQPGRTVRIRIRGEEGFLTIKGASDESNRTSSSRQYSKRIQGNKGNDDDQGTDCGGCAADVL